MKEKLNTFKLILASASPRRQMLLHGLDLDFEVKVPEADEVFPQEMPVEEVPIFLSRLKADAFKNQFGIDENTIVITADTIVILNEKIIGKPIDADDAKKILSSLSGNKHKVITGVCLTSSEKEISFSAESDVYFRELSKEEIEYYVEKYTPYDKAGAYGIQEWIGYIAIKKIEGSFYNVMGLPTQKLYEELLNFVEKL